MQTKGRIKKVGPETLDPKGTARYSYCSWDPRPESWDPKREFSEDFRSFLWSLAITNEFMYFMHLNVDTFVSKGNYKG